MILLKLTVPLFFTLALCDVAPGQNQYLPPQKGYTYDKPSVTFSTPTRPPTRPSRPTRPVTRPTPGPTRKPFVPTQGTYLPPGPTVTYRPTPTYTQPPQTQPTYRPTKPTYIPPGPTRPRPSTPGIPPYEGQGTHPDSQHEHHEHHDHHHHHEPGMPFDFTYAVNDIEHGNDYSHNAVSDGDITRGEYRIKLPDGRTQVVKYTADWKNGFNAQVSFEGTPSYPNYQGQASGNQGQGGYKY